ncbi:MAG: DUF2335 domain-containing protein [Candidatus Eisenbacteria bacterium]|nr:DUF2335 domain-containing protein [Candidatus Eisenbacteria bacterium]
MTRRPDDLQPPNDSNTPQHTSLTVTHTTMSGPLPHPALVEHYERISPGAADRIFTYAEDQLRHRHEIEKLVVQTQSRAVVFGQWIALTVILAGMGLGALLAYTGQSVWAFASLLSPLATVAALFIKGRHDERIERIAKARSV